MKKLLRILLVVTVIIFIYYYTSDSIQESTPLEGPNASSKVIPKTDLSKEHSNTISRPTEGMSTWINRESSDFQKEFGKPSHFHPSAFGYEWWVYSEIPSKFMMVGVDEGIITQVYIAGKQLNASPFTIAESVDEIYRSTILDPEVSVTLGDNIYTFSLRDEDMRNRMLVQFEDVYAQLYVDEVQNKLQAVRFTDGKTLVMHKPYEMSFEGDLLTSDPPTSYLQGTVNTANEQTVFEMVNFFREQYQLPVLQYDKQLSIIATSHSKDMMLNNFLSHDSPTAGSLKERLEKADIQYDAAAENIASDYYDGIEAAHGWLNSEEHRQVMLGEKFTHVGSGVFLNYYTQLFIEKAEDEKVNKVQ